MRQRPQQQTTRCPKVTFSLRSRLQKQVRAKLEWEAAVECCLGKNPGTPQVLPHHDRAHLDRSHLSAGDAAAIASLRLIDRSGGSPQGPVSTFPIPAPTPDGSVCLQGTNAADPGPAVDRLARSSGTPSSCAASAERF